jgi:hypothetical protein
VEEVIERAQTGLRHVMLVGAKPKVEQVLAKLGVLRLVDPQARFSDRLSALTHAAATVAVTDGDPASAN